MTPYTRLSPPAIRKSTAVYTAVFRAWTTRVAMRLCDSATGRGFLHKRAAPRAEPRWKRVDAAALRVMPSRHVPAGRGIFAMRSSRLLHAWVLRSPQFLLACGQELPGARLYQLDPLPGKQTRQQAAAAPPEPPLAAGQTTGRPVSTTPSRRDRPARTASSLFAAAPPSIS